jgi:hypothetical protein
MSYDFSMNKLTNECSSFKENEKLEKARTNNLINKQAIEMMKTAIQNDEEESITTQLRMWYYDKCRET